MCYELTPADQPLQQGDIFFPLPHPKLFLDEMEILSETAESMAVKWIDIKDKDKIYATVELEKSWGIVATQNCDSSRVPLISLFQLDPFETINKTPPRTPKAWVETLTERICKNASWFYLPKDERLGIDHRMVVNFHKVFQVPRLDLVNNIELRRGRLIKVAYEHYRESIAQYYRRYPYNEWYPFEKAELEAYAQAKKCPLSDFTPIYPMNER